MKITAINGSPKGREGSTDVMVEAFLKGAREAGAETVKICLSEKKISHCRSCFSCWFATPERCAIDDDDMAEIFSLGEGADILVLATPLKYANISSMLKIFVERLLPFANPYIMKDQAGETRHPKKSPEAESSMYRAKFVMMASGGLGQFGHFQVVSNWVKRFALNNLTEVAAEIYCPQGILLTNPSPELQPLLQNYLTLLERAGREMVTNGKLTENTNQELHQTLLPEDVYLEQLNGVFEGYLQNVQHRYVKPWEATL